MINNYALKIQLTIRPRLYEIAVDFLSVDDFKRLFIPPIYCSLHFEKITRDLTNVVRKLIIINRATGTYEDVRKVFTIS